MDIKEYQGETRRTRAPNTNLGRFLFEDDNKLMRQLLEVVYIGHICDTVKRSLFYRDGQTGARLEKASATIANLYQLMDKNPDVKISEQDFDLLHAMVGAMSEVGELIQEFVTAHLEGRELDKVNLKEEWGDVMWYTSLGLDHAGSTFEEAAGANIAKLRKRYPDKFTSAQAVDRDTAAEREVLETSLQDGAEHKVIHFDPGKDSSALPENQQVAGCAES